MSSTSVPSDLRNSYVVDSWPLVEMAKGRNLPRMDALLDSASRGDVILLLSEINMGELFYLTAKEYGLSRAETVLNYIRQSPCQIVSLAAGDAMKAARFKAVHKISYADAFTASLALENHSPVVTGDPDFLRLRELGIVEVEWLGA